MSNRARTIAVFVVIVLVAVGVSTMKSARGQTDSEARAAAMLPSYQPSIRTFLDLLSKGKIDDALATIDMYKDQPDARDKMRNQLIQLYSSQQRFTGYDIVAVQRFSPRLQSVSVLAYYNLQPILFQFDFYHPDASGDRAWLIPGFAMHEKVVDDLKDVPVDYHPAVN